MQIRYTNKFQKDYKTIKRRGYEINKLKEIINILITEKKLPTKYKEHYLVGKYKRTERMSYRTRLATNLYNR